LYSKGNKMKLRIYLGLLVLMLAVAACSTPAPGQSSSQATSASTATPFIAPSYPTTQAESISPQQVVSGIDVRVDRAWQDGKQVYADVCYTMPDASDWTIWKASLKYSEVVLQEFGTTLLNSQAPTGDGQSGQRCDTLEFYVPPDANLSTVTVSIDSIGSFPRQEDYCEIYMPKIQQTLNERGIAISLACNDVNGAQMMQIVGKPDAMSQEEAEQLVYSDEFFTITGPWEFTFNLAQ
jgi:hypothetical protein